jgi:hypothetical protein
MFRPPSRPIPPARHAAAGLCAFAVTLACGFVVQNREALAGWGAAPAPAPVPMMAALAAAPLRPPAPAVLPGGAPAERAAPAALAALPPRALPGGAAGGDLAGRLSEVVPVAFEAPEAPPLSGAPCGLSLAAGPAPLALIAVAVEAPCAGGGALVLHHAGLSVTVMLDAAGHAEALLPALAPEAVVMAEAGGHAAVAAVAVPEAAQVDRAVLLWEGERGVALHAREFGAGYGEPGHVHAGAPGDPDAARRGEGGMMLSLGDARIPGARMAEVYTFPTGAAARSGQVALSVEAQVTEATCGRVIEAQTIQISPGAAAPLVRELALPVPGCEFAGEWLVLGDMVLGLTVAAR